jgi:hypothetical protein
MNVSLFETYKTLEMHRSANIFVLVANCNIKIEKLMKGKMIDTIRKILDKDCTILLQQHDHFI